jgi:mono/diheme cytochrome c family protein
MKRVLKWFLAALLVLVAAAALVWMINVRDESDTGGVAANPAGAELIVRGAYLARAGNCMACHTTRGGEPFAGGRAIETPFGAVYTSNLTPDEQSGIGSWSAAHFWRAMHNGRSKDGRLLYPAFPYTSYTQVTREDSDALFAYLRSVPAVFNPNHAHTLQFPFDSQAALAVWRALYFTPGVHQPEPSRSAEWNRGAYLVQGLGHCSACHSARNALGATTAGLDLAGGLIPMQNWYAPSLASKQEAGVADWERGDIVGLLKDGVSKRGSVSGPMAGVVLGSTQYLTPDDLGAMAQYLKELPPSTASPSPSHSPAAEATGSPAGAKLYEQHCAGCHGLQGDGVPKAYPALAGNRAVTMAQTANLVQIVLHGGFSPATQGNPRPFGMPPFVLVLTDAEIAAVLTHLRQSWGNQANSVTALDVNRMRANQGR